MAKSNSRFNSGSGVFTCECCGHRTRLTSSNDGVCEHCYELAGIDNYFNDTGDYTSDTAKGYLAEANSRIEQLRANGGDAVAQKAKDSCDFIWAQG